MLKKITTFIITVLTLMSASAQEIDFINDEANHIVLNGADWDALRTSLTTPQSWQDGKWQVVHIGDSHIQAGTMTAQLRIAMQEQWGNGGRGLLPVLRIAGTNQPADYTLSSSRKPAATARLLSRSWSAEMGLTGVTAHYPDSSFTTLHIATTGNEDRYTRVTAVHAPHGGYETARVDTTRVIVARQTSDYTSRYDLERAMNSVDLTVPCGTSDLWGVVVENDTRGVMVHTIGNNGATASSYNRIPDFAATLSTVLQPRLIIVSLGTNEAFGSLDGVERSLDKLVKSLQHECPSARILLTTPMECHKHVSHKVSKRVKTGRGKRARFKTVTSTVSSYAVNPAVKQVRDIILAYGKKHHIATWDLYAVAGGNGAASRWIGAGLMNGKDHLHQLDGGYELQGILLAEALLATLAQ